MLRVVTAHDPSKILPFAIGCWFSEHLKSDFFSGVILPSTSSSELQESLWMLYAGEQVLFPVLLKM